MKTLSRIYNTLIMAFLYAPIVVLIVFSFNGSKSRSIWNGFSLQWYEALWVDAEIREALWVTLKVAVLSALFATVIGVLAAVGIHRLNRRLRKVFLTVNNLPMVNPEIVTGISLMLLFIFAKVDRGYFTMVLAHITFDVPYVVLSVMPKLKQMNKHTYEAALDLGATPGYALWHVLIPECKQGIVTGALLAFTLSLDDFTISYFTTSPLVQNLSTLIYSATKLGISPVYYALSSLMFVVLLVLLMIVNRRTADNN